jgi:N-methylhydantoinase B
MNQDALYVATNGGGGYLDPLQRDPEAVLNDVRENVISLDAAKNVYGAVLTEEAIDVIATAALRQALVAQRRNGP